MTKREFFNSKATQFGTDKANGDPKLGFHGYMDYYADNIPEDVKYLLEIGIAKGASALMWDSIFGVDNLNLHYIDLFQNPDFVSERWCINRGIIPYKGDQSDISFLSSIKTNYDVIIDDGSHRSDHVLISFKHLFVNNLKPNGIYFIEDAFTSTEHFYLGDCTDINNTPLMMFRNYCKTKEIINQFFQKSEAQWFEHNIDFVKIFEDKLIMIKRK